MLLNRRPLKSKWVLRLKEEEGGSKHYKAKLLLNVQREITPKTMEGEEYDHTFGYT